jgi:hypothetical protein
MTGFVMMTPTVSIEETWKSDSLNIRFNDIARFIIYWDPHLTGPGIPRIPVGIISSGFL